MIDPRITTALDRARYDVMEIYQSLEEEEKVNTSKIRLLVLNTLMQLDKCLEVHRKKYD